MEGGQSAPLSPEEDAAAAWASAQKTWGELGRRILEVYSRYPPFTFAIGDAAALESRRRWAGLANAAFFRLGCGSVLLPLALR